MKSNGRSLELKSFDEIFSTQAEREILDKEHIEHIPLTELHAFKNHPFKVRDDDDAMIQTVDSVKEYGVITPAIARPDPEGGYEIVSGHRRHRASELAGLKTMPVIVRNLDDDAAILLMVDSNLQRETILPSERAFAYKMKMDAMKRIGGRPSKEKGGQIGPPFFEGKSRDILAEQTGSSARTINRIVHLTELIPPLLDMVDDRKIALNPAYELSFLSEEQQQMLLDAMEYAQATPSLSQAQKLKKFSQSGPLTSDMIKVIMSEEKKGDWDRVTLKSETLRQYFPKSYTPQKMQETIISLLEEWQRKQNRNLSR